MRHFGVTASCLLAAAPAAAAGGGGGEASLADLFWPAVNLLLLLGEWGPCPTEGECPADLDGDRDVDFTDLLLLLHVWGTC